MAQDIVRKKLDARGLDNGQEARLCGISVETVEILRQGHITLPCIALKVGRGLRLTRQQVAQIGKAMDKGRWEKNVGKLSAGQKIDFDPGWIKKYHEPRGEKAS